jgi:amidase
VVAALAERPLIVAPVCLRTPFAPDGDLGGVAAAAAVLDSLRIVLPINLLGLPAVALPVGVGEDGLPLGVQVIGPRFREDACLAAAAAIEAALGTVAPIEPRGASARLR